MMKKLIKLQLNAEFIIRVIKIDFNPWLHLKSRHFMDFYPMSLKTELEKRRSSNFIRFNGYLFELDSSILRDLSKSGRVNFQ